MVLGTLGVVICVNKVVVVIAAVVLVASPAKDSDTGPPDLLSRAVAVVVVGGTGVSVKILELKVAGTSFGTVDGETPVVAVVKLGVLVVGEATGNVLSVLGPARGVSAVEEVGVVSVWL